MLRELDDKRGELGQNSLGLKDGPRQLSAEASKWAARRNVLNRATEQQIDRAQEFKNLWDECNKNVAQSKRNGMSAMRRLVSSIKRSILSTKSTTTAQEKIAENDGQATAFFR